MATFLATAVLAANSGDSVGDAARNTSIVFAIRLFSTSLTLPYSTQLASRIGLVRTFWLSRTLKSSSAFIAAIALAVEMSVLGVLIGFSLLVGLSKGLRQPLSPPLLQAYSGLPIDEATATNQMVRGAAAAVGALVGGLVLSRMGPEAVFLGGALVGIPVIFFLIARPPSQGVDSPDPIERPWGNLVDSLRSSNQLRTAVWLGITSVIVVGPLINMLVPVLHELGHRDTPPASLFIAVVAVVEILTPLVLRRLRKGRAALVAATRAMQICGIALLALCLLALLPNTPDFFVLGLSGFVFGAVYFCVASFLYRSATIGLRQNQEEEYLAAYLLVTGLGAPIGTLLWGHLLGAVPLEVFFFVLSVVAALVVPVLLRHALQRAQSDMPTESGNQSSH